MIFLTIINHIHVRTYICSALFRNLRFLGIPRKRAILIEWRAFCRKRTMGSVLFRSLRFLQKTLRFLGIPRTLPLAQVGAAISTVPQWAMVEEMAAPTWARARARAGPHPACVRACTRSGRCCAFYRNIELWRAF